MLCHVGLTEPFLQAPELGNNLVLATDRLGLVSLIDTGLDFWTISVESSVWPGIRPPQKVVSCVQAWRDTTLFDGLSRAIWAKLCVLAGWCGRAPFTSSPVVPRRCSWRGLWLITVLSHTYSFFLSDCLQRSDAAIFSCRKRCCSISTSWQTYSIGIVHR